MLFNKKFEVVEIYKNGVTCTTHLNGKSKNVKKDIEKFKKSTKNYQMVGKNGMIVWR